MAIGGCRTTCFSANRGRKSFDKTIHFFIYGWMFSLGATSVMLQLIILQHIHIVSTSLLVVDQANAASGKMRMKGVDHFDELWWTFLILGEIYTGTTLNKKRKHCFKGLIIGDDCNATQRSAELQRFSSRVQKGGKVSFGSKHVCTPLSPLAGVEIKRKI